MLCKINLNHYNLVYNVLVLNVNDSGSFPKPGEISLAHNGVLFLDELTEFNRRDLDMLREPMETGKINISRAAQQVTFFADFLFLAAANPCGCGYYNDESGKCRCTPDQVRRYQSKLSGPLLDRIDIRVNVNRVPYYQLQQGQAKVETSHDVRIRVTRARKLQLKRQGKTNGALNKVEIEQYCVLTEQTKRIALQAVDKFQLSNRSYHQILKLSRTIADLQEVKEIAVEHLSLAIQLCCHSR